MVKIINFTGYIDSYRNGSITQIILRSGKQDIRVGETVFLYCNLRNQNYLDHKGKVHRRELFMAAQCTEVLYKCWSDIKNDVELAERQGCISMEQFRRQFSYHKPNNKMKFIVIRWEPIKFEEGEIVKILKVPYGYSVYTHDIKLSKQLNGSFVCLNRNSPLFNGRYFFVHGYSFLLKQDVTVMNCLVRKATTEEIALLSATVLGKEVLE